MTHQEEEAIRAMLDVVYDELNRNISFTDEDEEILESISACENR